MITVDDISGGNDLDVVLFFTDGNGEPKKLNVSRCIEEKGDLLSGVHAYNGANRNDFLLACQRTPQKPIEVSWDFSGSELDSDNFGFRDGLQFSYQVITKDNFVSAPATFSDVEYPPALVQLGERSISSISFEDEAILKIPAQTAEAKRIRILFREGNTGVFKIIDEVSAETDEGNEFFVFDDIDTDYVGRYVFRYNRIYAILPDVESSKTHDNLPKKAVAQSIAGNRLMYGNYTEGYDPVPTKVNITPVYSERPKDLQNLGTTITPTYVATDGVRTGGARGHSVAFSIECGLDSNVAKGLYDITISMSPQKNIHLFNEHKSLPSYNMEFNGSMGFEEPAPAMVNSMWATNYGSDYAGSNRLSVDGDPILNIFPAIPPQQEGSYISNQSNGFAKCGHVSFLNPAGIGPSSEGGLSVIGSNAANPLVLGIENVQFNLIIQVLPDDGISPSTFVDVLNKVLVGHSGFLHSGSASVDVLYAQGVDGPIEAQVNGSWPGLSFRASYDKAVEAGTSFEASSQKTNLISYAVDPSTGCPSKFFIVNKFTVDSSVVLVAANGSSGTSPLYDEGDNPQSPTKRYFRVHFTNFVADEVLTCIPSPHEGFGTVVAPGEGLNVGSFITVGLNYGVSGGSGVTYSYATFGYGETEPVFAFDTPFWIPIINQNTSQFDSLVQTYKWPIIATEGFSPASSFGAGQPGALDILDKDNSVVSIASNDLNSAVSTVPVPIGKWHAYSSTQIADGSWKEDFEVTLNKSIVASQIGYQWDHVVRPASTEDWLRRADGVSISKGWSEPCTFVFHDFSYDQSTAGRYITAMDGEAGIGGANNSTFSDQTVKWFADGDLFVDECNGDPVPSINRRGTVTNLSLMGFVDHMRFLDIKKSYYLPADVIPNDKKSAPLSDSGSFLSVAGTDLVNPFSFKTNDFHDFGIVYFDDRGRPGGVNKLDSVYVQGYGDRGQEGKGSVSIRIGLEHEPPIWAKTYKIVYGGSSNTRRFIQYTAAGAFVENGATGQADDKIYVSLNHLQESKASYAKSYGAKDVETGESLLYRFAEGDKLRIVSYFEDDSTVVFPSPSSDYTFDVVGMEIISRFQDDNPIFEETDINTDFSQLIPRTGSFAVIRNNTNAEGFSASNVFLDSDFWGQRCVFEIVTPKSEANEQARPYYETGVVGDVITIGASNRTHSPQNPVINRGDVFFRAVPTNIEAYSDSEFQPLISADEDGNDTSESRFLTYYLETNSLTDVYKSTAKSYGKPYFIDKTSFEHSNGSSIIYSAATGSRSNDYEYTSFNPQADNTFDLPFANGNLDYMHAIANELLVIQNSKVGKVQVNKSLTTSSDGIDTLNLSDDVLSSARFFQAELGTYGHPESVSIVNSSAYFVDKPKGAVVEVSSEGIKKLSDNNMGTFFQRKMASLGDDVRITTGYNPDKDELIVSAFKTNITNSSYPSLSSSGVDAALSSGQTNLFPSGDALTFAYSMGGDDFWSTEYSFHSSQYSRVGDKFLSFKNGAWLHDVKRTPSFYGDDFPTLLRSVLVEDANKSKDFKAISIDGEFYDRNSRATYGSPWVALLDTKKESKVISKFRSLEGTMYSEITRSGQQDISRLQIASLGLGPSSLTQDFATSNGDFYEVVLNFRKRIDDQHITISDQEVIMSRISVYNTSNQSIIRFGNFDENDLIPISIENNGTTIRCVTKNQEIFKGANIINTLGLLGGTNPIIIESRSDIFGDSLRDKMMSISLVSTNTDQNKLIELYSVNTEYIQSNLDSSS